MKHIAIRSMSVRQPDQPFTTPGLGDRIHQCTVGWAYGQVHGVPVTLHLTQEKVEGGQFGNKAESWAEVVALFPAGSLAVQVHPVTRLREPEWIAYLRDKGIDADGFWYGDFPGEHEPPAAIDIAPYLKRIPPLVAEPQDVPLPAQFYTAQWDSNHERRTLPREQRAAVMRQYRGCKAVTVGGEAQDRLRWSLAHIAYAMSRAEFHVGVDSAFMHLALLYMGWERLHLYNRPDGFYSHHAQRARANGAQINRHL